MEHELKKWIVNMKNKPFEFDTIEDFDKHINPWANPSGIDIDFPFLSERIIE